MTASFYTILAVPLSSKTHAELVGIARSWTDAVTQCQYLCNDDELVNFDDGEGDKLSDAMTKNGLGWREEMRLSCPDRLKGWDFGEDPYFWSDARVGSLSIIATSDVQYAIKTASAYVW